jgi:hypothetical protein
LPQNYLPAPPQEAFSTVASVTAGPTHSPSPVIRLRDFLVSKSVSRAASARASPEGTPRSGTPPGLMVSSGWHVCIGCGQPVKDGWPRCPSCHTTPVRQVSAALQGSSADLGGPPRSFTPLGGTPRSSTPRSFTPTLNIESRPGLSPEIPVAPDPVWIHMQTLSGDHDDPRCG